MNVVGAWFSTEAFLGLLRKGSECSMASSATSQVVMASSLASLQKSSDLFSFSYGLSKAAMVHLPG
ncbi:uncharacterized protein LAESUDRAFT_719920 [Laetiporus sulphureus 93-53]|uniref:Uncharacterized protein n=1 Tax=Laetiporus sulphureus 93-53 TaxID=1314785 RepID=A0A165HNH7_9APHY|nr:uncharacterized protein LAESUDRAFT_719920 [Laetiporus sulphureus 93-53]KZT11971.1 hypothetical protein LAESUDRAFT_719920 [Laetiporus sulphureus 93-53]